MIWVLGSKAQSWTPKKTTLQTRHFSCFNLRNIKTEKDPRPLRRGLQIWHAQPMVPDGTCITLPNFANQQCHVQGTSTRDTQHWQQLTNYGLPTAQPVLERCTVLATCHCSSSSSYQYGNTDIYSGPKWYYMVVSPPIYLGVCSYQHKNDFLGKGSFVSVLAESRENCQESTQNCIIKDTQNIRRCPSKSPFNATSAVRFYRCTFCCSQWHTAPNGLSQGQQCSWRSQRI